MKRRVVLHGPCTLTVSLPMSWVKKLDVRKGDELNVEEHGKELRIRTGRSLTSEKKDINMGSLKRLGGSYLTSLYRQGYDEINFVYDDIEYIESIRDLISKELIGFEIIQHRNNSCLIKDLTRYREDEFDTALKRIWLLLLDLAEESFDAMKHDDAERLKNIKSMDHHVNKFSNYCLRLLTKEGHIDFKKTLPYCYLIRGLEEVGDRYKDLCAFYVANGEKSSEEFMTFFQDINDHLGSLQKLYYAYDEQKVENLLEEVRITYDKMSHPGGGRAEIYLSSICKNLTDLLKIVTEIAL